MKEITTPFILSGDMKDWNPAIDQTFDVVLASFEYDVTSEYVPLGVAMLKFAELLEALDWHLYVTGKITVFDAREKIKWASGLMDKKFDIDYKKLPR